MSVRPALPMIVALAVVAAPVALAPPAQAATDASKVVISEVYGGGGAGASTWQRDYVELYNPTDQPVDLGGTSVRSAPPPARPIPAASPRSAARSRPRATSWSGGHRYDGAVPTPSVSGSIQLSGTSGTVFLANQATALTAPPTGSLTGNPAVLDLVGYGSSNTFERRQHRRPRPRPRPSGLPPAPTPTTTRRTSARAPGRRGRPLRPFHRPAGRPAHDAHDRGDPGHRRQPARRDSVTTDGVVTAAYPTGGFNGFYLQTAGTGGDVDPATHQASDAVFVFGSAVAHTVHVGDHVQVTGKVTEFQGTTEITPAAADVKVLRTGVGPARVRRAPEDGGCSRVLRGHAPRATG